jgi:hypothetical protein
MMIAARRDLPEFERMASSVFEVDGMHVVAQTADAPWSDMHSLLESEINLFLTFVKRPARLAAMSR